MKVHIRDIKTGFYFKERGCWVTSADEAAAFESSLTALTLCDEQNFQHAEIVLRFGEKNYDIRLPVAVRRATP